MQLQSRAHTEHGHKVHTTSAIMTFNISTGMKSITVFRKLGMHNIYQLNNWPKWGKISVILFSINKSDRVIATKTKSSKLSLSLFFCYE